MLSKTSLKYYVIIGIKKQNRALYDPADLYTRVVPEVDFCRKS